MKGRVSAGAQALLPLCQRWRQRRDSYVPVRDCIRPALLGVEQVARDRDVSDFIAAHHYLGSMPAARERFVLTERGKRVGVAVFGQPVNDRAITNVLPGQAVESLELQRLVLLDEVAANAESWFVARCHDALRRDGYLGVISFSDPEPRTVFVERPDGAVESVVVRPGHLGIVYQALGFCYVGRSEPKVQRVFVGPDRGHGPSVLNKRSMQKIRAGERGWNGAARQIVSRGADEPPQDRQGRIEWLARWVDRLTRPQRHGGVHKYVIALDARARRHVPDSLPYPKWLASASLVDVSGGQPGHPAGAPPAGRADACLVEDQARGTGEHT